VKRSTPLRPDPDKVRDWQDRSRKQLDPGTPKVHRRVPNGVRNRVRHRSGGWCVVCLNREGFGGGRLARSDRHHVRILALRGAVRRIVHLHHVLPKQTFPEYETEELNLVGVCSECHEHHERPGVNDGRMYRDALPGETKVWIAELGDPMLLYYEKTYR
jgi:hypothetical protein